MPQNETVQKEVIFHSVNKEYKLGADKIQAEERFSDGRMYQQSKIINFVDHIYKTSDPAEIEIIKNASDFALGRVRVIDEKKLGSLLAATTQVHE